MLDYVRSRHGDMLDGIRKSGAVVDETAFDGAIKAFADQFSGGAAGISVEAEAQSAAQKRLVDSEITLPEEEIDRDDDD